MSAPTILDAMDDPELFGPFFKGNSWDAWRTFLQVLFGLQLQDRELACLRHHTGRTAVPLHLIVEAALICGRRGGKSRILALIATYLAMLRDYSAHLAPSERATVAVIAADRRQARGIFRYIEGLIDAVPILAAMVEDRTAESLYLSNRVQIEIHTASFLVTRGYTLCAALCDEIAFWRTDDSANPDAEILKALRPGMASIPGSILLMASSPYAKRGALYASYRKYFGRDDARVLVWRGTTSEMNPRIDPEVIAEAIEDDPAAAAAEYLAEFRDDIAAFVLREVVDACTVPGRYELARISGQRYVAFVDPSGGSSDSMTLAIAHREDDRCILEALREKRPPFSPEAVVGEFADLLKSYSITRVSGDHYAGEWPREQFRKLHIDYDLSEQPKSDMYRDLLPSLNSSKAELLDNNVLTTQLCNLERRTSRGGRDSIDHPPNAKDDVANAATGALLLCAKQSGYDTESSNQS